MSKLSWKPVLKGKIYCSPACGGNCTLAQFNQVTKLAIALAKRLGDGWEPVVKENLHWFWCVHNKKACLTIWPGITGDYSAWYEPGVKQWIYDAKTPEKAIKLAVNAARAEMKKANAAFDAAVKASGV